MAKPPRPGRGRKKGESVTRERPTMTAASSLLVSWCCSPPIPAMHGCSTARIYSPHGSPEMERANQSTSRKPILQSPSSGRAAIASRDRHSSTRIKKADEPSPSSATPPISSLRKLRQEISNMFGCHECLWCFREHAEIDVAVFLLTIGKDVFEFAHFPIADFLPPDSPVVPKNFIVNPKTIGQYD